MDKRNLIIAYYLWRKRSQKSSKRLKNKRRFWVREIFSERNKLGAGSTLVEEMRLNPENMHFNFFRMNSEAFDHLLKLVAPHITKSDLGREPISPRLRLALTLRYLASGDSMMSLSYAFRLGKSTVSAILSETLPVIWTVLQPLVLKPPNENDFLEIAAGFNELWNYPNCIGAIDGKHVWIQAPPHAGSSYYNYKGNHSVILMAVVNHQYEFILVDIGAQGRQSDGGVFRNSLFGRKLNNGTLNIPSPAAVSEDGPALPFVIVGDEAFPLLENLMRPFPGKDEMDIEKKIYNYRHSRARRVSENAFGILVTRWRIFSKPILAKLGNVDNVIKASVCLHNFLIKHGKNTYITPAVDDNKKKETLGERTFAGSQLTPARHIGTNTYSANVRKVREEYKRYFNEEGAVPWQWNLI